VRAGGHHLGREVAGHKDEKENGRPHGMDTLVRLGRLLEAKKQVAGAGGRRSAPPGPTCAPPTVPGLGGKAGPGRGPRGAVGRGLIFLLTKLGRLLFFTVGNTNHKSDSLLLTPFYLATPTSTHLRHHF
jgi:hypothetical protein